MPSKKPTDELREAPPTRDPHPALEASDPAEPLPPLPGALAGPDGTPRFRDWVGDRVVQPLPDSPPAPDGAPPVVPGAAPAEPATAEARATVEVWAAKHSTPTFVLEGARYLRAWGIGSIVTEAQYLAAVEGFSTGMVG